MAQQHPLRSGVAMVTIGTMLATMMQALDTTIANVALPYMSGTFASSYDESTWVLTSYIVAAAIMTPPTGWLAARLGRRRLFLISVLGFTVASALCGLSQSLSQAVIARVLQGMAGAALVPLSQAILLDSYPREKHGQAMAIWGMGIMLGPILGPTLGGWLTQHWSWRWVYFINLPIGVLAALVIGAYVRETETGKAQRFDLFGFTSLSIAIACLQFVLDRGQLQDWFASWQIIIAAALAVFSFYIFVVHIFTTDNPFIRPNLFLNRNFALGLLFIFIVGLVLYGTMALFPPLLQDLLDFPVVTVGILLAPRGVGTMIAMLVVGRLTRRLPPRALMVFGFLVNAYSMWGMSGFSLQISAWDVFTWGVLQGFGLGFIFVPLTATAFATLAVERRTEAAGIYSLIRNLGSSIGISIVTTLVTRNTQINHASLAAHLTPLDRTMTLTPLARMLGIHSQRWLELLNQEITRQASMIGYIDDFKLMMILTAISVPLVLLMSSPPAGAEPDGGSVVTE
ncbi:MAG TPA: DHA2 family efflux MFS transporter permease subunit [Acetobacteraceae bacterium]|nr:DHA2 family efflux MFS transporter permease subunit [Acetobacteraceae bacterium]